MTYVGFIDILCRGALYFLVLGFRLYSVPDAYLFKAASGFVKKSA